MEHCTTQFPLLEVAGIPYEMGYTHGAELRGLIDRSMAICREVLPVSFEQAMAYACRSLPYSRQLAPELMEEVQGIADGAGYTLEEIFTLNASLDLQLSQRRLKETPPPDCWTLAVKSGDRTFITWTAEDSPQWFEECILLKVRPAGGTPSLMWTFAGFVGRPGINPHLGLSAAAQLSDDCHDGLPYPFICRKVMDCQTTGEAITAIAKYHRMAGMAYTIADQSGEIATVETSARAVRVMENKPGWTASSGRWAKDRLGRIEEMLGECGPNVSLTDLQRMQADHGLGNLCAHDDSGLVSLCTFIGDVPAHTLWVTHGSSCENAYVEYTLY